MKAFMVGLLALIAVVLLYGLGTLLLPFLLVLGLVLRVVLIGVLVILAIWLLGRVILYIWEKMR